MSMGEAEIVQGSLFEDDFLVRTLGVRNMSPFDALTELVANSWDAGATIVDITIPTASGGSLVVKDDGTGMTPSQFKERWMKLSYNRIRHQGQQAEFPPERSGQRRRAYGRNGVGRHSMLCFASEYEVETWKDGEGARFLIRTASGKDAFVIAKETPISRAGHGTVVTGVAEGILPTPETVQQVLSARFLQDPAFTVRVNGEKLDFSKLHGVVTESNITISGHTLNVVAIDISRTTRSPLQNGIAFWVGNRIVGEPSWIIGNRSILDGRTRQARNHVILIRSTDLYDLVLPDWSGFKRCSEVQAIMAEVSVFVEDLVKDLFAKRIEETAQAAISANHLEISKLSRVGKKEVLALAKEIAMVHPLVSPDTLSVAVQAAAKLEQARQGVDLLRKLSNLSPEDVDGLDTLLNEWSIQDALSVLDEIDRRIKMAEAIERLSGDNSIDELKTLHPLVLQARWVFGPEFDSPLYSSNRTIRTALRKVLKLDDSKMVLLNDRKRPDIIVIPDGTISAVVLEEIEVESSVTRIQKILLIELKKGGFEIGRKELSQAQGYVEDLLSCGIIPGRPFVTCFVVGHSVSPHTSSVVKIEEPFNGRIEATTYGQLVSTANARLFRLKDELRDRYEGLDDSTLFPELGGQMILPG